MNPDPNDIVRQALEKLADQNALAAARIEVARLRADGDRMRRILADLQEVETNAVTKAVIREAIQRWADALGDGR